MSRAGPEIEAEVAWTGPVPRPSTVLADQRASDPPMLPERAFAHGAATNTCTQTPGPRARCPPQPETSTHPELLGPLGRRIARAAEDAQLVAVSRSDDLIRVIDGYAEEANMIESLRQEGVTTVAGRRLVDEPPWYWPDR